MQRDPKVVNEAVDGTMPSIRWRTAFVHVTILLALAAVVPVWLLASAPPIWQGWDSVVQISFPLCDSATIPHYGPLYPFFARTVQLLTLRWYLHEPVEIDRIFTFPVSDEGLFVVLVLQHLIGVGAAVALACAAASTLVRRILVLILFLTPMLLAYTHQLRTEALWLSLIVWQCAFALRIWKNEGAGWGCHAGYYISLWLGILTRHPGAVFAALLPGLFVLELLARRGVGLKRFGLSLGIGLATVWLAGFTTQWICREIRVSQISLWGRAAVYRIGCVDWDVVGHDERDRLIASMSQRTTDPLVQAAIPLVFDKNNAPWLGVHNALHAFLQERGEVPRHETINHILNTICRLYLTSGHPVLHRAIYDDILAYAGARASAESGRVMKQIDLTYGLFGPDTADLRRFFAHVRNFQAEAREAALERYRHLEQAPYFRFAARINDQQVMQWLLLGTLAAVVFGGLDLRRGAFIGVLFACLGTYFVTMSIATIYIPRYACINPIIELVAFGTLLGGFDPARMFQVNTGRLRKLVALLTSNMPARAESPLEQSVVG